MPPAPAEAVFGLSAGSSNPDNNHAVTLSLCAPVVGWGGEWRGENCQAPRLR